MPLSAHLSGRPHTSTIASTDEAERRLDLSGPSYTSRQAAGRASYFGLGATRHPPDAVDPKWLELCVRSGPHTWDLREIDISGISGVETDASVFLKIKREYERAMQRVQPLSRHFGRYSFCRIPTGGVSVKVSFSY